MSAAVPSDRPEDLDELTEAVLAGLPTRIPAPVRADFDAAPRIGLVLGAGGVLGNAYVAGALAALHEVTGFEPRTASVLVGTSAGAVHAALAGAGMPALFGLWRVRGGRLPTGVLAQPSPDGGATWSPPLPAVADADDSGEEDTLRAIFTPARALPRIGPASRSLVARTLLRPWAHRPEVALSAWLPEGMLTNSAIGQALRRIVPSGWAPHPRTWIVAVDLHDGRRTVFGQPDSPRAHLDRAVRASCAIPAVYRPVRIGRRRYVDGSVHSPSNADLLVDCPLDLAVVINPMSTLEGHAAAGLVDRYLAPLRHMASRRLAAELRLLAAHGVPTLVLQPSAAARAAFSRNLMDPRPRRQVAETALASIREALDEPDTAEAVAVLRAQARSRLRAG